MYIILGATGHIGSALAQLLLDRKQAFTVVTRSGEAAAEWERKGARAAVLDVHDVSALHALFKRGTAAYLLNPPANPATDIDAEERATVRAILAALKDSGLQKVVAQSTYGAQPGAAIGDLGVLYELEQGLQQQPIPATIVRGAYYMSNWDMALDSARSQGVVDSFFPAELKLPMVAPADIAQIAGHLLTDAATRGGLYFAEGPQHYCSEDVAAAFGKALGKPVKVRSTPPERWVTAYKSAGFCDAAAQSMAAMTKTVLDQKPEWPEEPVRGETTLERYIASVVAARR